VVTNMRFPQATVLLREYARRSLQSRRNGYSMFMAHIQHRQVHNQSESMSSTGTESGPTVEDATKMIIEVFCWMIFILVSKIPQFRCIRLNRPMEPRALTITRRFFRSRQERISVHYSRDTNDYFCLFLALVHTLRLLRTVRRLAGSLFRRCRGRAWSMVRRRFA